MRSQPTVLEENGNERDARTFVSMIFTAPSSVAINCMLKGPIEETGNAQQKKRRKKRKGEGKGKEKEEKEEKKERKERKKERKGKKKERK